MSFYSDFLDNVGRENLVIRQLQNTLPVEQVKKFLSDMAPFNYVAQHMKRARIIRVGAKQSQVFMDTPILPGQDYAKWFRLPFPDLYIQIDQPFPFTGYLTYYRDKLKNWQQQIAPNNPDEAERVEQLIKMATIGTDPLIKGMVISEETGQALTTATIELMPFARWCEQAGVVPDDVERILTIAFLMPIPDFDLNMHGLTIAVTSKGLVSRPPEAPGAAEPEIQDAIRRWVIHLINFMGSPNIKLVPRQPTSALQKARQKSGKPPLPGWYELIWKKEVRDYTRNKFSAKKWEHQYRYDVIGHQRIYRIGRAAGRVVWVRPHQRGLKHSLYKPAVRILQPMQETPS